MQFWCKRGSNENCQANLGKLTSSLVANLHIIVWMEFFCPRSIYIVYECFCDSQPLLLKPLYIGLWFLVGGRWRVYHTSRDFYHTDRGTKAMRMSSQSNLHGWGSELTLINLTIQLVSLRWGSPENPMKSAYLVVQGYANFCKMVSMAII